MLSRCSDVGRASRTVVLIASALLLQLGACAPRAATVQPVTVPGWDFRTVAPDALEETTLRNMLERIVRADVVVFGEQHDDPETHRAQLLLLESIGGLGRPVVLSLEMFERDVQPVLDDFLAGRISEAEFLTRSRPWPRYATDYRPLVELARSRGWPVVAANVPRPFASAVGSVGLEALDALPAADRVHAARDIACPDDDYRARFLQQMRSHSPGSGPAPQPGDSLPTAMAERFYLAQCVKDETMAESIAGALRRAPRDAIVLHVTGAFHSDHHQGTVDRVRRRLPETALVVITAVPVRDPAMAPIASYSGRADFVVFTRRP